MYFFNWDQQILGSDNKILSSDLLIKGMDE